MFPFFQFKSVKVGEKLRAKEDVYESKIINTQHSYLLIHKSVKLNFDFEGNVIVNYMQSLAT